MPATCSQPRKPYNRTFYNVVLCVFRKYGRASVCLFLVEKMSQNLKKRKAGVSGICRTCLNELDLNSEQYSVNAKIPGFKTISDIIRDITTVPVVMTDLLPKFICSECYDNFQHMAEFRELIRASHLNLIQVCSMENQSLNTQPLKKNPNIVIKEETIIINKNEGSVEEISQESEEDFANNSEYIIEEQDHNNSKYIVEEQDHNNSEYVVEEQDPEHLEHQQELEENRIDEETEEIHIIKLDTDYYVEETDMQEGEEYQENTFSEVEEYQENDCSEVEEYQENNDSEVEEIVDQTLEEEEEEEGEILELQIDEDVDDDVCIEFVEEHINANMTKIQRISDIDTTYECNDCNKVFHTPYLLINHKKVCATNRNVPGNLVCNVCDKSFTSNSTFKKHYVTHMNKPKNFPCGICNASFQKEETLIEHLNYHAIGLEYKCLFCTSSFKSNDLLKDHVKCYHCHFKCKVCSKGFTTADNLRLHEKFSHQYDMVMKTCPFCEKTMKSQYLNSHILKHTK